MTWKNRSSFYLLNILLSIINVIHVLCSFSILLSKELEKRVSFSVPSIHLISYVKGCTGGRGYKINGDAHATCLPISRVHSRSPRIPQPEGVDFWFGVRSVVKGIIRGNSIGQVSSARVHINPQNFA